MSLNLIQIKRTLSLVAPVPVLLPGELAAHVDLTQGFLYLGLSDGSNIQIGSGDIWGGISGTLSAQTDLQLALDAKVVGNAAIVPGEFTKITYDAKGLITAGIDATTVDIDDSFDRRYVTDAQLAVIANTSNINSGDQTTIVGITGTKAEFDTACTDGDFIFDGGPLGTPSSGTLTNCTGLPISTGISGLGTGIADFLATPSSANLITAMTDETGTGFLVFSDSPDFTGVPTAPTAAPGTNTTQLATTAFVIANTGVVLDGNYTDITVSAVGTIWTIDPNVVTNAKLDQMATKTYKGRTTAGTGDPEDVPAAALKADLAIVLASADFVNQGTTTTVLHGNAAGDPSWGAVDVTTDITGTLPVVNGGTGQTSYTDGQLLIGNTTGNTLVKATLTDGAGIKTTLGAGSITIASTVTNSLAASKSGNASISQFLQRDNNIDTNLLPFVVPFACTLIYMTAMSDASGVSGDWTAEIYKNGVSAQTLVVTANKSNSALLALAFAAGDEVSMYFTKTAGNVKNPSINAFFREIL